MILDIILDADPSQVLQKTAQEFIIECPKDYGKFTELITDMFETLVFHKGVGLAAPQVCINKKLFIVAIEDFAGVFINPKIIKTSENTTFFVEGCLSVPNCSVKIERPETIQIEYYDQNFRFHNKEYNGLLARIIQHEYDHLQGILIKDYLPN